MQYIPLEKIHLLNGKRLDPVTCEPDADGLIFEIRASAWTSEDWLILDLTAEQESLVRISFDFYQDIDASSGTPPDFHVGQKLIPGIRVKAGFPLQVLSSRSSFLPPQPGQYKSGANGLPTHVEKMRKVLIRFNPAVNLKKVIFHQIGIFRAKPDMTVLGKPLVDELGQIAGKNWPGKTSNALELRAFLQAARRDALQHNHFPASFSAYGGWLEKRFEPTGWFCVRHDGRRWWLADPDGYAFLSNGVCYGNRMGIYSFIDGMESLCQDLPDKTDPVFKDSYMTAADDPEFVKRNGRDAGKNRWMHSFPRANMMRAFGADWWKAWADINGARLKHWGINTIGVGVGNYPDEHTLDYLQRVGIPFVWSLLQFPLTELCIFRDFPDVFSPEYQERSAVFARQLEPLRDNRNLIGYFITNEPEWLFQKNICLAERLLAHPANLASKQHLITFLRERYPDIHTLNQSWQQDFQDFDALLSPIERADLFSSQSRQDLLDFDAILIAQYARVPSAELRQVDPNHLNLGMRSSHMNLKMMPANQFFAAFSFNCYKQSPKESLDDAAAQCSQPMIIGEWHIAAADRGLLGSGLVQAANQEERAKALTYYMEQGYAHPSLIGMHYFEYSDMPPLGRFDGATGQSGWIDVCNRPYESCVTALTEVAGRLYAIADGRIKPTCAAGQLVPPIY
jgi:hypothetical protein